MVITGPTATGKSAIALLLAERMAGEIISVDSMQVYREMDIGTAKPTPQEQERVPHHLIDVADPEEDFSVARYKEMAETAIRSVCKKGRLPFLVGGTGLYLKALLEGFPFPPLQKDEQFRRTLEGLAREKGKNYLHERLSQVDTEMAAKLHPNDHRRIIRSLEVYHQMGEPPSLVLQRHKNKPSPYRVGGVILTRPRPDLYKKINERVDSMVEQGLVQEVQRLIDRGCTLNHTSMQGLGYREIYTFLEGQSSLEEAKESIKKNTRRFAKRQLTWFRHQLQLPWYVLENEPEEHRQDVETKIKAQLNL